MSTWEDTPGEVRFTVADPAPGTVCVSATCQRLGTPAAKVVSFPRWLPSKRHPGSFHVPLWRDSWGRTRAMCEPELDRTLDVVRKACEEAGVTVHVAGREGRADGT